MPDPSKGSSPNDPTSWNKYAYVQGDPINFNDSSGLARCWLAASVYDPYAPEHSFAEVYCQSEGRTLEEYHSVVPFTGDEARLTKSFEETFGAALDLAEQDYSLGEAIARAKRAIQNTPSCRPLFSADFDPSSVLDHLRNGDAAYGKFSWEAMGAGGNVAEVRGYEVNYAAASSYTVNVVINSMGTGSGLTGLRGEQPTGTATATRSSMPQQSFTNSATYSKIFSAAVLQRSLMTGRDLRRELAPLTQIV